MPCLDAKALETDPEGMAFLRSVLTPEREVEQDRSASPSRLITPAAAAFELARSRALVRPAEPVAATLPAMA